MEETNLVTGCMKAVLEKYTDPILRGIGSKFKQDEIDVTKFLFDISFYYKCDTPDSDLKINRARKKLLALLKVEKNYEVDADLLFINPYEQKLYSQLRQTWIGVRINTMANLRNRLEQKNKEEEMDLTALLSD